MADARLRAALGAQQLDVRRMQRRFPLDDAALDIALRIRLRVALDHVHAFHDEPVLRSHHFQHAPLLAAVLARDDEDVVVLPKRTL